MSLVDGPGGALERMGPAEDVGHLQGSAAIRIVERLADRMQMLPVFHLERGEQLFANIRHGPCFHCSCGQTR